MKLIQNDYDTVSNRLIHTHALWEALHPEVDLALVKTAHERLEAQAHHISGMASDLDLDSSDMQTVAVRLKEVLDNYLRPLEKAIEEVERYGSDIKRFGIARLIAAADAELRCLRFTMDLTSDSCLPKAA